MAPGSGATRRSWSSTWGSRGTSASARSSFAPALDEGDVHLHFFLIYFILLLISLCFLWFDKLYFKTITNVLPQSSSARATWETGCGWWPSSSRWATGGQGPLWCPWSTSRNLPNRPRPTGSRINGDSGPPKPTSILLGPVSGALTEANSTSARDNLGLEFFVCLNIQSRVTHADPHRLGSICSATPLVFAGIPIQLIIRNGVMNPSCKRLTQSRFANPLFFPKGRWRVDPFLHSEDVPCWQPRKTINVPAAHHADAPTIGSSHCACFSRHISCVHSVHILICLSRLIGIPMAQMSCFFLPSAKGQTLTGVRYRICQKNRACMRKPSANSFRWCFDREAPGDDNPHPLVQCRTQYPVWKHFSTILTETLNNTWKVGWDFPFPTIVCTCADFPATLSFFMVCFSEKEDWLRIRSFKKHFISAPISNLVDDANNC